MKTCQACGHRPAVVEFIQVSGAERREMSLCRECALSIGMRAQVEAFQRLSQLLMQQQDPRAVLTEEMQAAMNATCSECGFKFEEFIRTGLLGCPHCYGEFHDYLQPVLRRMHGVIRQSEAPGEVRQVPQAEPMAMDDAEMQANTREHLEMELHLALLEEDYERAASLRDRLKDL